MAGLLAGVRIPFLANEGQVDAHVAYYAPTFAGTVFVTRQGELVYTLRGAEPRLRAPRARPSHPRLDPDRDADGWPCATDRRSPRQHAGMSPFLGADPAQHRAGLPT